MNNPLGEHSRYISVYSPGLLYRIERLLGRDSLGLKRQQPLPFHGVDVWNAYELSWLSPSGKPEVAIAVLELPCESLFTVESKSLKLYLGSFSQSHFDGVEAVETCIINDLTECVGMQVSVQLLSVEAEEQATFTAGFDGLCLDTLPLETSSYDCDAGLLKVQASASQLQAYYTHLFKSNWLSANYYSAHHAIDPVQ